MKKLLTGLALLLVLVVCAGGWYFYANLATIVERTIEEAGTEAAGSAVTVEGVAIDLAAGSATVRGFALANPPGFSAATLLAVDEFAVTLDLAGLSRRTVAIASITARQPRVHYESRAGGSNLDALAARVRGPAPPPGAEPAEQVELTIAAIDLEDIAAVIDSDRLPAAVTVALGDVHLRDLQGTPGVVAQQILEPLATQLSRNAARELLAATARQFGATAQALGNQLLDSAEESAESVGAAIQEGFDSLLGRDDEAEAEAPAQEAAP